jgi:hypothetical protein
MAMLTGFDIDEASEQEMVNGGLFRDSHVGRLVIEAAREHLQQSSLLASDPVEQNVFFERQEDMGGGRLRLILDGDSDVSIAVISEEGEMAGVEFCTPYSGGGRSPKTREALLNVCRAIREENVTSPISRGAARRPTMRQLAPAFAVAATSWDEDQWSLLPNTLSFDKDSAVAQARSLADAGDSETKYTAVQITSVGVVPVGEQFQGTREL